MGFSALLLLGAQITGLHSPTLFSVIIQRFGWSRHLRLMQRNFIALSRSNPDFIRSQGLVPHIVKFTPVPSPGWHCPRGFHFPLPTLSIVSIVSISGSLL